MKRVCIKKTTVDLNEEFIEVENITEYLREQLKLDYFPETGRIYHNAIALENDVTPCDEESEKRLERLEGDFYVVIEAGYGAMEIAVLVVMAIVAAFSVYTYMTMPKPQVSAAQSANNDMASRQNQIRVGGRVPEIFGTIRCYPDMIAASYVFYNADDKEIEVSLMVIGRGYYDIHDCREDSTDVHDIQGYKVSVYDPFTSIMGDAIYQVGEKFDYYPPVTLKSKSINGQTLEMPNDQKIESTDIYFVYPNLIKARSNLQFTSLFNAKDNIAIYGAEFGVEDVQWSGTTLFTTDRKIIVNSVQNVDSVDDFKGVILNGALIEIITEVLPEEEGEPPKFITTYKDISGQYRVANISKENMGNTFRYEITLANALEVNSNWRFITKNETAIAGVKLTNNKLAINLSGSYQIDSVTDDRIILKDPDQVNGGWLQLLSLPNHSTVDQLKSIRLDLLDSVWVGWHNLEMPETEEIVFNFFFQNGLFYQDSKGGVWAEWMDVLIEYQYINDANQPIGEVFQETRHINKKSKSPFGTTVRIELPYNDSVRFRLARTTPTKNDKSQDLCKIKDVYAVAKSTKVNYGDVTVLRLESSGTDGALSLKEKKLNLLVTRKLPVDGTGPLVPTRDAGQALINLALDGKNGRRSISEVDIQQIKSEIQAVKSYFGSEKAAEFCYTIDDANLSFEEIAGMIASAVFCEPYRFGSKLRLKFEKPQEIAVLLFNHRNKVPQSETRTRTQQIEKDYDGLELEYTDPSDDARIKYYIWYDINTDQAYEGEGARNPMTIKTTGIRNHEQAKTRAWREWNKLQYRRVTTKFEALDESNLLARNDKILVADNCSLRTQDGGVDAVNGLVLLLSQDVEMQDNASYKICLQLSDGTVDIVPCSKHAPYQVVLSRPPRLPLVVDDDRYAKTTYQIVSSLGDGNTNAFMLTEMDLASRMTNNITAINYDDRYYKDDHRFF
ncbi:host specificity factor TipJ family phage tail protein [Acinetobacter larvae]|uniref:Tip attachment protein J HDII-ins2 domain-containing protein n=1 Tax=Acinetobacter larvae TaxID=1789224 RepID=A0A1B2LZ65_9GAMM|nr:host specificity factor TipJ family phage tail protein [Acinetobacter larvae]AOA58240.1 hypothetical protein BFG52_07655 [Acinetobacter larvae]